MCSLVLKVITGNPGTGKHTIANIISRRCGLELVDINSVALENKVFEKKYGVIDVNVIKLKKIIDKKTSKNSLLVGHLAPYVVSPKNVEKAIVLRRNPYRLYQVYKKRRYTSKKSLENLGSEILGVIYYDTLKEFGKKKTFQIDTTDKSVLATAKKVENIFKGKENREEIVDWLSLVMRKGDMQKFFPY